MDEAARARLLDGLAGLRLPADTGLAPAWWIGAALALLAILVAWRRARRARAAPARRRRAESGAELAALRAMLANAADEGTLSSARPALAHEVLARASTLARRLALAAAPRERVAALQGGPWLALLDELSGTDRFAHGPGRLLGSGPYEARPAATIEALGEVLDAVDALDEAVAAGAAGRRPA